MNIAKTFEGLNNARLMDVRYTPDGLLLVFLKDNTVIPTVLMLRATDDEHGREPYIIFEQRDEVIKTWADQKGM